MQDIEPHFGQWLQRKREEIGARELRRVSHAEIARRSGYSRQYIGFLEAGVNPATGKPMRPERDAVSAIARALGASEEEAFEAAGIRPEVEPRIVDVARRIERMNDSQLDAVRRMLELIPSDQHAFA